jgi:uncharacterized protein YbaR (Trm112 family)
MKVKELKHFYSPPFVYNLETGNIKEADSEKSFLNVVRQTSSKNTEENLEREAQAALGRLICHLLNRHFYIAEGVVSDE